MDDSINDIENFDTSTLSQITPFLIVTNEYGAQHGKRNGHWFLINTASELHTHSNVKIPVYPFGDADRVVNYVDMIADVIKVEMGHDHSEKKQIVLFCAMGMERSVLAAAWYLAKHQGYTLESAYKHIHDIRPIACDRSEWVGQKIAIDLNEDRSWELIENATYNLI
jgi:hypothetical protein